MSTDVSNFRLGIGIPLTWGHVPSQFFDSFVTMKKPNFAYLRPDFPGRLEDVRNALVEQAIESQCTHLIMIDTDEVFPSDAITRLLEHDLPIVGGKVHRRYPPFDPILYRKVKELNGYTQVPDGEWEQGGLVEVDATGAGCLLMQTWIFREIQKPWFRHIPPIYDENLEQVQKERGEDIYFCEKAREAGFRIFVDTGIDIGHLGLLEINEHTYRLYKMLDKERRKRLENNNPFNTEPAV